MNRSVLPVWRIFYLKWRILAAVLFCLFGLFGFSGCSLMVSSATSGMMDHLSKTILNNDDLAMVEAGAPAYLLMIDSLVHQAPGDSHLLATAATLYSAYADLFITDPDQSKKISTKALNYAVQAMCHTRDDACDLRTLPFESFEGIVADMTHDQVPVLFTLGTAWAGWIVAHKSDFNAIAEMARVEQIMQRVTELDKTHNDGAAYVYLGTMATLLPPALGGRAALGKQYFETALEISRGKNLMVKVLYAKFYARMMFDRPLHDRLLNEVLAADPQVPGYTLVNTDAMEQAEQLLAGSDDYF